jgi:colicin import membrane protein
VAETELQLQLKVWKDLAISKQMLMRAATDALQLDPDCSQEELKLELEAAIKRAIEADVKVGKAQEQAATAMAALEKKLADSQKAVDAAEAAQAEALANQQTLQQQITDLRTETANEVKSLKERLAEKERALKAINTALSDTPENVVKKLKALNKQKKDESDARKQVEEQAATLRKDKNKLEQSVKELKAAQETAAQLAERYRELHTLCSTLHGQLEPLVDDKDSLPAVPALDGALLEGIEKAGTPEEKKTGAKGKRR